MYGSHLVPIYAKNQYGDARRFEKVLNGFMGKFGSMPDFVIRVPGRVNIIGEHVDYCGYGVLPMATKQDFLCAVNTNYANNYVRICNEDGATFPELELEDICNFKIEFDTKPNWYDYILCGFKGIFQVFGDKIPTPNQRGFNIYVSSNVPIAAGLSSSSALVCASVAILNFAFKLNFDKLTLAEICAKAEHHIGTQGGGMDQAAIFLAEKNYAQSIEFNPLRCKNVQLPAKYSFLIIDSLVKANKAATADFNTRVIECRLAAMVLGTKLQMDADKYQNLAHIQKATNYDLDKIVGVVNDLLHDDFYERNEICNILGMTEEKLLSNILGANMTHLNEFKLKQRALHVYTEANRVKQFQEICSRSELCDNIGHELGQLMNESHTSLSQLYECSHMILDDIWDFVKPLVEGARMTGAGWGGCMIVLLHADKVDSFLDHFKQKFGQKYHVFVTKPESGASIFIP